MGMMDKLLNSRDLLMSQALVSSLGPVAGGYFGDLFYDLGEKRGLRQPDFSSESLDIMKEMVKNTREKGQTSGSINPKLGMFSRKYSPKNSNFIERHITSPYAEVTNALGKFEWEIDDKGNLIIKDEGYDWQHDLDDESWLGTTGGTATSGGMLKQFASKLAYETTGTKEGESIPYQFNLGKLD